MRLVERLLGDNLDLREGWVGVRGTRVQVCLSNEKNVALSINSGTLFIVWVCFRLLKKKCRGGEGEVKP